MSIIIHSEVCCSINICTRLLLLGNWTQALRKVVESVYSFFSYDVNTYVAGNLEIYEEDEEEDEDGEREGEGGGGVEGGGEGGGGDVEGETVEATVEKDEGEVGGKENEADDSEETDDAMSGADNDTSAEEDAFEDKSVSVVESGTSETAKTDAKNDTFRYHSTSVSCRSRSQSSSTSGPKHTYHTLHSDTQSHSTPTSKTISSFTVENILMGNTSRSNSTSSGSPTSAPNVPTTTFHPFTPHGASGSASMPVSPASANWTSHPPVKYTKLTMMSPWSMRSEGDKRKKGEKEKSASTSTFDTNTNHRPQLHPTATRDVTLDVGPHQPPKCKDEPPSPAPAPASVSTTASLAQSTHPHLTYHHSVIHTAMPTIPLSRQSSAQSVSAASPRVIPISPSTVTSAPHAQTQSPHQQQQYVVFFPPNLIMTAPTTDLQVIGQVNSSQLYVQSPAQSTNHSHKTHKHTSPHPSSSSPSPPPNVASGTAPSSNNHCVRFAPTTKTTSYTQSSPSMKLTDPRYHPIAPRADNSSSLIYRTVKTVESEQRGIRKIGTKSLMPVDKSDASKSMPKQKKLRFHMTTVVKKVKKRSSSVSLTAPPPSLCDRLTSDAKNGELETKASENSDGDRNDVQTRSANDECNTQSTTTLQPSVPTLHTVDSSPSPASPSKSTANSVDSNVLTPDPASETLTKPSPPAVPSSTLAVTRKDSPRDKHLFQNNTSPPLPPTYPDTTATQPPPARGRGRGRGRGRRARGYTRRKKELTFHLYEDPFRAKRTRQHN